MSQPTEENEANILIRLEVLRETLAAVRESNDAYEASDVLLDAQTYAQWVLTGAVPE
jgi:hypothetical protein